MKEFEIEWVDPRSLEPHPENWRKHPAKQRKALAHSLTAYGWLEAVVVNRTTGRILDGHLRVQEALTKSELVPVRYVEVSEAEERVILAETDVLGEMATLKPERQVALLEAHREEGHLLASLVSYEGHLLLEGLGEPFDATGLGDVEAGGSPSDPLPPEKHYVTVFAEDAARERLQDAVASLGAAWGLERTEDVLLRALREAVDGGV